MMNPYLSWAIVLVVAGGLGWYYNDTNAKGKTPVKPLAEKTESAPSAKKQKRKVKKSPEPSPAPAPSSEKPTFEFKAPEVDTQDEEIDRKEMAKRFAAVKNGTSSQFADGESKSQKKKKKTTKAAAVPPQPEASNNERSASRVSTRTSSTTGADADDDLSPAGSPQVNPTVSSTGYVSDMLEAPAAPGASVLRVTGSMDSDSQKKKAKNQSFKPVETKKQRQQRLKNEARKQQVQEAEEQRRKLLEKQLHTARESERRRQWYARGRSEHPAPQTAKVELLDTFEPGLPSEEEQMRILGATDDAWTTVSSKKTKKKGGKDESEVSASESQPAPIPAPISTSAPAPVEPKVKVTPTYLPDILQSKEKGHPLDSDWAA
ncbi:hypothetical protein AOCH_006977 [Aspergillus ochraceoroseus]|uniref:Uncharacterized protein n=1 Tax=Aspergillus ochraceoroseus TaxID=138278 RepID=A0A0F8WWK2_9EURO|nr:hypothetical protein AOCH_006977 [Aspergillus ochraceoroseus]